MTEEQRLKEQAVAIRLWDSFSLEQKKTVTDLRAFFFINKAAKSRDKIK
jgi:hypothetical protein